MNPILFLWGEQKSTTLEVALKVVLSLFIDETTIELHALGQTSNKFDVNRRFSCSKKPEQLSTNVPTQRQRQYQMGNWMGQSGNTMVLHSAYHYAFTFMLSSAFMFLSCMEKGKEEEKPVELRTLKRGDFLINWFLEYSRFDDETLFFKSEFWFRANFRKPWFWF